jgi:hypothetical protein
MGGYSKAQVRPAFRAKVIQSNSVRAERQRAGAVTDAFVGAAGRRSA